MTDTSPDRLHALDAVRGFALLLGVAFHATLSFLPGPQAWIVMDEQRSPAMAVVFFTLHMFRLTVFFLIAGFFGRMLLERRGLRAFVVDRARRIAAPLAMFWPVVMGGFVAVLIWSTIDAYGALPKDPPKQPPLTVSTFPLLHLWFLWVLLLCYAGMVFLRTLGRLVDRQGHLGRLADRLVAALVRWSVGPVVLAAPIALVFWLTPTWLPWIGIQTPDTGLIPNAMAATAYGLAFGLGWLIHRQEGLVLSLARHWFTHLASAVILTVIALAMLPKASIAAPMEVEWMRAAFAIVYALAIWSWAFGLVGAAVRFLSGHSPVRRYLADASYWIYIVHLPILMALQVAIRDVPLAWEAKYALIIAGTMAPALITYELLVRHSFIGRLLNGRRIPWRAKPQALAQEGIA
ncbi:MAG TPA: acyltransferase family protein [Caulobacter sp.]|nr:acyltransferase family protein [Caulobacter sp.]